MGNDDGIRVVQRGRSNERLAPLGRKVFIVGNHDVGQRVQLHELIAELLQHVIWYNVHGLFNQPKAFLLHATGNHFNGLARSYRVRKVGVSCLHHAPYGPQLVGVQLVPQADSRQCQV